MSETPAELLVAAEVARWLRIRCSTIYAWAATGKIPSVRLNGAVRFVRADIQLWLDKCSTGSANTQPSTTHPIVTHKRRSVSRATIQQAGERTIRRVTGPQVTRPTPQNRPLLPTADNADRKGKV